MTLCANLMLSNQCKKQKAQCHSVLALKQGFYSTAVTNSTSYERLMF